MSSQPSGFYTVRSLDDVLLAPQMAEYQKLMRELDLSPAPERRIGHPGDRIELRTDWSRFCVWDQQDQAQEFAEELARRTRSNWIVVEIEDPSSEN